jgi:hypothetical protein
MGKLTRYRRKQDTRVVAVQLRLETDGFVYRKWEADQRCKSGDWLVDNQGEVYTIDADTFARTYQSVGPGLYEKVAAVWAEVADAPGAVPTQEGETHYEAGDYLVYEDADRRGGYAISAGRFDELYEPMDEDAS